MSKLPIPDTKAEVQRILAPAEPEWKAFWFKDGTVVSSLEQLAQVLGDLDCEVWSHHVNPEKNDLVPWVMEVLGDTCLAKRLQRIRRLPSAQGLISDRLQSLRSVLE